MATYANTLLVDDDYELAREQAERALAAARAADAPWVEADALVTLGSSATAKAATTRPSSC